MQVSSWTVGKYLAQFSLTLLYPSLKSSGNWACFRCWFSINCQSSSFRTSSGELKNFKLAIGSFEKSQLRRNSPNPLSMWTGTWKSLPRITAVSIVRRNGEQTMCTELVGGIRERSLSADCWAWIRPFSVRQGSYLMRFGRRVGCLSALSPCLRATTNFFIFKY